MTAPLSSSPAPRQLSDVERALWEKATAIQALNARERLESPGCYRVYEFKPDPAVILSLLTALSSEREAGEREAGERDKARLDWMMTNRVALRLQRDHNWYYAIVVNGNHIAGADRTDLRDAIDAALTSTETPR